MKKKILIGILIIVVLAAIGGVTMVIINKNEKDKKYEALKQEIIENYDTFKKNVETFLENRTAVYEQINSVSYFTELSSKYNDIIDAYKKYEESLKVIEDNSTTLKEDCLNHTFKSTDTDVNNKVEAFIINYEQAFNYFINDVKNINDEIDQYNDWVKNVQVTTKYKTIAKYESTYTEYVDLNDDGVFKGAEEEKK